MKPWRTDRDDVMHELDMVVCRQTDCSGRGFKVDGFIGCMFCADVADDVLETWFRVKANKIETKT